MSVGGDCTVIETGPLEVAPDASFTMMVIVLLAGPVGVPRIGTELVRLSPIVNPVGSVPEVIVQVNGLLPPLALMFA